MKYAKGDGVFKVRGNKIYVHGTIDGKFYRKSTGKKATSINKAWIKKQDPLRVLADIVGFHNEVDIDKTNLEYFGKNILELTTADKSYEYYKDVFRIFNNYILASFQDVNLEDIKPIDIVIFINSLKEKSLSNSRIKFIKTIFNLIFEYAEDNELVSRNPFRAKTVKRIELDTTPENSREAYTTDEVELILRESTGWLKVFLDLAFKTGLRTGELMAIKWSDINFDFGILEVQRSITKGIIKERKIDLNKNKNHDRKIYLFPSTLTLLKGLQENRRDKENWVFINRDDTYYKESKSIVNSHFKPLLAKIGVKYKTLYATRATYASVMNETKDLVDIQKTLGHKVGSNITKKHYIDSRVLKAEYRKEQAEKEEALFNSIVLSKSI